MIQTKEFTEWLKNNTRLSDRVIRDTVSRAKRIDKIYSIDETSNIREYVYNIEGNEAFMELIPSVRSQCKKAIRLYFEYTSEEYQIR